MDMCVYAWMHMFIEEQAEVWSLPCVMHEDERILGALVKAKGIAGKKTKHCSLKCHYTSTSTNN